MRERIHLVLEWIGMGLFLLLPFCAVVKVKGAFQNCGCTVKRERSSLSRASSTRALGELTGDDEYGLDDCVQRKNVCICI